MIWGNGLGVWNYRGELAMVSVHIKGTGTERSKGNFSDLFLKFSINFWKVFLWSGHFSHYKHLLLKLEASRTNLPRLPSNHGTVMWPGICQSYKPRWDFSLDESNLRDRYCLEVIFWWEYLGMLWRIGDSLMMWMNFIPSCVLSNLDSSLLNILWRSYLISYFKNSFSLAEVSSVVCNQAQLTQTLLLLQCPLCVQCIKYIYLI